MTGSAPVPERVPDPGWMSLYSSGEYSLSVRDDPQAIREVVEVLQIRLRYLAPKKEEKP